MKIKSITAVEFKRYTNLRIEGIPETARLVVMAGPNGAGKSSLFEALNFYVAPFRGVNYQPDYHQKAVAGSAPTSDWSLVHAGIKVEFHNDSLNPHQNSEKSKKAFYFRSAYRHEGDFTSNNVGNIQDALDDARRPPTLISAEARVSDNFSRLVD